MTKLYLEKGHQERGGRTRASHTTPREKERAPSDSFFVVHNIGALGTWVLRKFWGGFRRRVLRRLAMEKGSEKGFLEGGFQKVPRTPPSESTTPQVCAPNVASD